MARIRRGGQRTHRRQSNLASNDPKEIRREQDELYKVVSDLEEKEADLRELLEAPMSMVVIDNALPFSVPDSSATPVAFAEVRFGIEQGVWDVAAPTRLLFPKPGRYMIGADLEFANAGAGNQAELTLILNSSVILAGHTHPGNVGRWISVSVAWEVAAEDYIEVWAFQDSGGPVDAINGSLWWQYVGAAAKLSKSGPIGGVRG